MSFNAIFINKECRLISTKIKPGEREELTVQGLLDHYFGALNIQEDREKYLLFYDNIEQSRDKSVSEIVDGNYGFFFVYKPRDDNILKDRGAQS